MNKTETSICVHCLKGFKPNPRLKRQRYCQSKPCQRARRALWQRQKIAGDPDYRDNKIRCQKQWHADHPGYYRHYRKSHPEYTKRNRLLQQLRNARRRNDSQGKMIAKLDSLIKPYYSRKGAMFRLIPQTNRLIAKLDSLRVKLVPI